MNKKIILLIFIIISFLATVVSFSIFGLISGNMIPPQDPPPEIRLKHDEYVRTYTPIIIGIIILTIVFTIITIASSIKLTLMIKRKQ